ncbi:TyrR/PhhR family helix-turn-helix DNA-binding protein [Anaerospora sp.]|uniref:TyrR/PhhR family helix-turn-helix DNA-binding protein n=1 Tax=Anaerospora sp. TaxID=1960278 RepID=UPI0028A07708|nr:TyrR/PhhR family helix-turn-helix DNA-binding protein [Anaerospora sp.]
MRLCMTCTNRPGLLLDISQVLANQECDIVALEVVKGALYLECYLAFAEQMPELIRALQQVEDIHHVSEVAAMPSKERAEQLEAVLSSLQDGLLSINLSGIIEKYNKTAINILNLKADSLEQPLPDALLDILFISRTIREGHSFRNQEVFIAMTGRYCTVSTRPMRNENGKVTGAVIVLCESQGSWASKPKTLPFKKNQSLFLTGQTLEASLGAVEREILQATIRKFHSSRQAGAVLGLSHTAILKKLKKHGLQSGSY